MTETERLAEALELLDETADLVREFGNALVTARGSGDKSTKLGERLIALDARGRWLPPPITSFTPRSEERPTAEEGATAAVIDHLSGLITDISDKVLPRLSMPETYVQLSAYIKETVLAEDIPGARAQPWKLLGFDHSPDVLGEIALALSEIDAVLTELVADEGSANKIVSAGRTGPAEKALTRAADWARRQTQRRERAHRKQVATELRSLGLPLEFFWADGDPLKGESSKLAVAVAVESMVEWLGALEELVAKVEDVRELGEMPLFVPVLRGHSVPLYARKLIRQLHPVTDLEEFDQVLPSPLDQRLTGRVVASISALELCSALSVLGHEGELDERVAHVTEGAKSDYQRAVKEISGLGTDAVVTATVDLLEGMALRIEEEWRDESKAGAFAESMAEVVLGGASSEMETLEGALMLSVQWDADPSSATAMLESAED